MSRIKHETPMNAYDHVTKLLEKAAGPDRIVSRDDAKALAAELRADGRGTEALIARNLFKMIDKRETEKGARVTGVDLNTARAYVQEKLLERVDTNHDGYSKTEIAKMSPTGKALVELGRTLESDKTGGRVAYRVPELGMEHVANLISSAAGSDGVTSREDRSKLLDKLYKAGRGTEALAVGYFFGFIDHRDADKGARVTKKDVSKALDYSREHLLRSKDGKHDGYSKKEIDKFSTSAKAFLLVGQMIDAGIIKAAKA